MTKSWKNVVAMCNESTTADGGGPVFPKPLKVKAAQTRFNEYIEFMKVHRNNKPSRNSGEDNEPFPELLQALEDLYDLDQSWKNATDDKRAMAVDAKVCDRAEGEAIREAGLGIYVRNKNKENENDEDDNPVSPTQKKTPGRRYCAGEEKMGNLENVFEKYAEKKEENKRRKLELEAHRLELEEKRLAAEQKEKQMQHQLMMAMITKLGGNIDSNDSNNI